MSIDFDLADCGGFIFWSVANNDEADELDNVEAILRHAFDLWILSPRGQELVSLNKGKFLMGIEGVAKSHGISCVPWSEWDTDNNTKINE